MSGTLKKYWMSGTYWFTEEACQAQCKVIHARLGQKEAPTPIYLAADVELVLSDTKIFLERLCGEGDELTASARITLAQRLLARLR